MCKVNIERKGDVMKFGYIRKDEDGHNYLVPEEEIKEFDALTEETELEDYDTPEWNELVHEFNNKFWKYRCGGLGDFKVVMPDKVK